MWRQYILASKFLNAGFLTSGAPPRYILDPQDVLLKMQQFKIYLRNPLTGSFHAITCCVQGFVPIHVIENPPNLRVLRTRNNSDRCIMIIEGGSPVPTLPSSFYGGKKVAQNEYPPAVGVHNNTHHKLAAWIKMRRRVITDHEDLK